MQAIASYIDHTLLKPTAKAEDILHLCKEAVDNHIKAVCVSGNYVALAKEQLTNTNVLIAARLQNSLKFKKLLQMGLKN
jgi:deoxyribose-phosphate aldolase